MRKLENPPASRPRDCVASPQHMQLILELSNSPRDTPAAVHKRDQISRAVGRKMRALSICKSKLVRAGAALAISASFSLSEIFFFSIRNIL